MRLLARLALLAFFTPGFGLIGALGCGCVRKPDSNTVEQQQPDGPVPPVASDVTLELRATKRVDVGDDLAISLQVRNDSRRAITLVRPIYGSWELARHPRYALEWTDERGEPVLDPLGFAPGLECGTLDLIKREDLVAVRPGASAAVQNGPSARTRHEVLPSARPGRYTLRVRYLAQGIEGATELQILSAPVEVEIVGGDPAMWACRAEQLAAEANHEWVSVSPAGVVRRDDGLWLLYSAYRHRVIEREREPGGEAWAQRLGEDLRPLGDPVQVRAAEDELGWMSVGALDDRLLLVATPGPVGQRRVEAWSVDLGPGPVVIGELKLVQARPGNPYVTRVLERGDRLAILHRGADTDDGALMLSLVDRKGAPLGSARRLAQSAIDFELLAIDQAEMLAIWLERGKVDGGVMQRLTATGEPVGRPIRFDFDPSHSFAGSRLDRDALELAWSDSSTRGDDPRDVMALYARRFSMLDGHPLGPPKALTPESREQPRFGAVAWHGDRVARAYLDGADLHVGVGSALALSHDADGTVKLVALADGFLALWTDRRDDDSRACRELDDCIAEIYGARLREDGSLKVPARRLTTRARAKPFVASPFDWQQHCP